MSQSSNPLKQNLDDRLADFTDDLLEGRKQYSVSSMEEELLQLEKTVFSIRTAFPPINMDEARIKQMQVRLKNRIKREQEEASLPFWQKLFSTPQYTMMVGVVSLLIVFLLVSPSVTVPTGSSTTATAINPVIGPLAAGGLVAVIVIILWIKRRK